jgi:uncharacterized heparinase superfamily protein
LGKNIEYQILANHLLENAFALCIGGLFIGDDMLLEKGKRLLNKQLEEQILPDGGHFERSPMYHQILLGRLLDLISISGCIRPRVDRVQQWDQVAGKMLGWIEQLSFNGTYLPLINDSAFGIAPDTVQLLDYGRRLGIQPARIPLKESGFRKFKNAIGELIADVGNIMPSYQPGHSHAGTFGFELYVKGTPLIVDTGTSTYDSGERRMVERSTKAHNTVTLSNNNSSEVWASHRVGRRATSTILTDQNNLLEAIHDGYRNLNRLVTRTFTFTNSKLSIIDSIKSIKIKKQPSQANYFHHATAHLHFHPDRKVKLLNGIIYIDGFANIYFEGQSELILRNYWYAPQFNKLQKSKVCDISFGNKLVTRIEFIT